MLSEFRSRENLLFGQLSGGIIETLRPHDSKLKGKMINVTKIKVVFGADYFFMLF